MLTHSSTAMEVAFHLLELFRGDPNRWTQGAFSRNSDGESVSPRFGISWDCVGGIHRIINGPRPKLSDLMLQDHCVQTLEKTLKVDLVDWNDNLNSFRELISQLHGSIDNAQF